MNTGRGHDPYGGCNGSEVLKPAYCKLKVGALLTNVFKGNVTTDKDLRYISGNVLTGKKVSPNGFLGSFDSQLTVIPEGDEIHEMLVDYAAFQSVQRQPLLLQLVDGQEGICDRCPYQGW